MIIKQYDEVPAEQVNEEGAHEAAVRWVLAEQDGAPNFYLRVFELGPGGRTPLHNHAWEHEIFVLEGNGCVVRNGEEIPLSSGNAVLIPPDEEHQLKNKGNSPFKLICLIPKHT
jgi:quercetin dioxygenase-like cupin family protein